uniref:Ribosomal protein S16 n=1 Tax=Lepisorus fortuni TaxID=272675 RepID=A0A7T1FVB9_9MONI|nr:ribosomal protein S16 [Neolepisorus fortunei]QPM99668.1 ribosomal protein S16 [Neolepisorus fortunei]
MAKPRLKQHDKKQCVTYRIIVTDTQSRRDKNRYIQEVGFYNPHKEQNPIGSLYFCCSTGRSSSIKSGCFDYFERGKVAQTNRNKPQIKFRIL